MRPAATLEPPRAPGYPHLSGGLPIEFHQSELAGSFRKSVVLVGCRLAGGWTRQQFLYQAPFPSSYVPVTYRNLAAAPFGSPLLSSCGGNSNTTTSTPTSMLGTESAAAKAGCTPADTAATTSPR
ncbi:MAG: hypothetical protein WKG07_39180 [Hymenobacter sp.]